ncbi:hypothetical protein [Paenibacillus donghaensis]|uniref:Uncharacterized protein n=1 Tax=Paenibacillus donghaensis TaxID=414771 RepID=A0A2Z2KEK3_9BACL|nr:hypothetical protein [Paenibacillus donghaensis]ASA22335.1 hypothetical protein B9T62_17010 [Paenibacillus donghaensis]
MDPYLKKQERILMQKKQYAHLVGTRYTHKSTGEAYFVTGIYHDTEYGISVTNGAWSITIRDFLKDYE